MKHLYLVNVNIKGNAISGGLVGEMVNSIIENCSVTGNITALSNTGGLVGVAYMNSTIMYSFSEGFVKGNVAGGLVGMLNSSAISNSYSHADVAGAYIGGIAGIAVLSLIENCYATGNSTDWGNGYEGGIGGYGLIPGGDGTRGNIRSSQIKSSFWDLETSAQSKNFGYINPEAMVNVTGKSSSQMKETSTFTDSGWDFDEIWALIPEINNGYPYLRKLTNAPIFSIDHSSITFEQVEIGQTTPEHELTIANTGTSPLTIFTIEKTGAHGSEFNLARIEGLPWTIEPHGTKSFAVSKTPLSEGEKTALIIISHNAIYSPNYITLFGDSSISETDETIDIAKTELWGNYPNPFNPETVISFSVKNDSKVTIDIYNIKGQRVKSLVNDTYKTGNYNVVWNGRNNDGNIVSSGLYFYRMKADGYSQTRKMILIK